MAERGSGEQWACLCGLCRIDHSGFSRQQGKHTHKPSHGAGGHARGTGTSRASGSSWSSRAARTPGAGRGHRRDGIRGGAIPAPRDAGAIGPQGLPGTVSQFGIYTGSTAPSLAAPQGTLYYQVVGNPTNSHLEPLCIHRTGASTTTTLIATGDNASGNWTSASPVSP